MKKLFMMTIPSEDVAGGGRGGSDEQEGLGEERSDKWKIIGYVERRYSVFAVASLHPSVLPSSPHLF